MKRLYPTLVLTGMLALSLSACSSMGGTDGTGASSASLGATGDPATQAGTMPASGIEPNAAADQTGALGASGASGAAGSSDSSTGGAQDMPSSSTPAVASTTPNSTVISIEPLASASTGSSTSGSSASSGTTGGSTGAGQAYRVTLRMDDGSTQVVSQATPPTYRSGDRVNLGNGVISR